MLALFLLHKLKNDNRFYPVIRYGDANNMKAKRKTKKIGSGIFGFFMYIPFFIYFLPIYTHFREGKVEISKMLHAAIFLISHYCRFSF